MTLLRDEVLQTIKNGKRKLAIEDMRFEVKFVKKQSEIGKRAEIFIRSTDRAEIMLYPTATLFSVRHELCHAKLFKMGVPLTNTKKDRELFPDPEDYMRMVVIVEWYINELQKSVFDEYYVVDDAGTPRPPPYPGLPKLPKEIFTHKQIQQMTEIAKEERGKMNPGS